MSVVPPSPTRKAAGVEQSFIMDLVTEYRGIFVCLFLLPISVFVNILDWFRLQLSTLKSNAKGHSKRVQQIALTVRQQGESGKKLCTDRPGWATMSLKGDDHKKGHVRIPMKSLLIDIIDLDAKNQTVKVEPLVNMGQLSRFLIPRGFTLPVVPELDELTVGGLLMGFGIESSSHIHGLFQEVCVEYEVVLGDGQVVCARADNEFADLFYALPWSYGTLGLIVGATLKVIPCKPYVRISYRRFDSCERYTEAFAEASTRKTAAAFVEGLAYSLNKAVIMEADFCAEPSLPNARFNDIGLWYKKWFFVHADELTSRLAEGEAVEEIVPLRSYYHRHTRGIFWQMPYIIPFADQAWFRYLLGWAVPPNIPLMKSTQTPAMKKMWREQFMVQDMLLPMTKLRDTMKHIDRNISVYPIWLCPHLVVNHAAGGMLRTTTAFKTEPKEMFVDIGVYGVPQRQPFHHVKETRALEALVREYEGYQGLYAVCYMDREEFRTMFHHELYDACRDKYQATKKFPEVCEKIGIGKAAH